MRLRHTFGRVTRSQNPGFEANVWYALLLLRLGRGAPEAWGVDKNGGIEEGGGGKEVLDSANADNGGSGLTDW